jgi:hypothetical protein
MTMANVGSFLYHIQADWTFEIPLDRLFLQNYIPRSILGQYQHASFQLSARRLVFISRPWDTTRSCLLSYRRCYYRTDICRIDLRSYWKEGCPRLDDSTDRSRVCELVALAKTYATKLLLQRHAWNCRPWCPRQCSRFILVFDRGPRYHWCCECSTWPNGAH